MSRTILAAATLAAAALMPQAPAAAQGGITVIAPRAPNPDEPKSVVHRQPRLFSHVFVPTGDLNLRTSYGRYALDQRMRMAAATACYRLSLVESAGVGSMMNPDPQNCRHRAYKMAQQQARFAIARG